MKKKIILICLLLSIVGLTCFLIGCNSANDWRGTYYACSGYANRKGIKLQVNRDSITVNNTTVDILGVYSNNDGSYDIDLALAEMDMTIVENNQVIYFNTESLFSFGYFIMSGNLNRNELFDCSLWCNGDGISSIYIFRKDGTFSYIHEDGRSGQRVFGNTKGTYNVNNGVIIRIVEESNLAGEDGKRLTKGQLLNFFYISSDNDIYSTAFIRDYNYQQFQKNQSDIPDEPSDEHTHVFSTLWVNDSVAHWKECMCGEKSEYAEHSFSGDQCTVCGYVKEHTHSFGDWEHDDSYHWKSCSCGEREYYDSHSFSGDQCTVCGYVKEHTHSFGDWEHDDSYHWKSCSCGEREYYDSHSFSGDQCAVCGYTKEHTHSFGDWEHDDSYHWKSCSCGVREYYNPHIFIGGQCTVCGSFTICYRIEGNGCLREGANVYGYFAQIIGEGEDGKEITAVPNDGYEFVIWSDGVKAATRTERNVQSGKDLTAYFRPKTAVKDFSHLDDKTHLKLKVDDICPVCGMECYDIKNNGKSYLMYDRSTERLVAEYYGSTAGNEFNAYFSMLTEVYISSNVEEISQGAFYECNLNRITFQNGSALKMIGDDGAFGAFENCRKLYEIDLSICKELKYIGRNAFDSSGICSIEIPESVTSMGTNALYSTPWFANCPSGMVYLQHIAYCYKDSMPFDTTITVKEGTKVIADYCFYGVGANLRTVKLPSELQYIGDYAFSWCAALKSLDLPDSLQYIGSGAFGNCTSFTSITIPESVTHIGDSAFYGCDNLKYNYYNGDSRVKYLGNEQNKCLVLFSADKELTQYTIPNTTKVICYSAFYGCDSLTSITIPEGVISIGNSAFYNCGSLTSIVIPEGVISIGGRAFEYCGSLTSITIPEGVISIGGRAFNRIRDTAKNQKNLLKRSLSRA